MIAVPFGIYLLLDHYIFGVYFFSWTLEPDLGIPWILTLLACYAILDEIRKRHAVSFTLGLILLFGAILVYAPFESLKTYGDLRTRFAYSRIDPKPAKAADEWGNVCVWVSDPQNTPRTAKFWTPKEGTTFQWNARRSCVGLWKNIPQDAAGIVQWKRAMEDLFAYSQDGVVRFDRSLAILLWWKTNEEIESLRQKYGFEYIICGPDPDLSHLTALKKVYPLDSLVNDYYAVYQVSPRELPLPK